MGLFCVNLHFQTTDHEALARAVQKRSIEQCYAAAVQSGWLSLYEAEASNQDDQRIRWLGSTLSADLQAPAIAFMVHDSDVACYWLFDRGELLDEFNSCPDYFGDGADDDAESAGSPELLARYCVPGTDVDDIAAALRKEAIFAEGVIEDVAGMLGIAPERALSDYRDLLEGGEENELDADFIGTGEPGESSLMRGSKLSVFRDTDDAEEDLPTGGPGMASKLLARMLGTGASGAKADPRLVDLIRAAADGAVDEIDRLVAAGADINGVGPMQLDVNKELPGLGKLFAGAMPALQTTPLLAAITRKQSAAVRRLLELGAEVTGDNALFGTPIHAAATAGQPEMLQLLIEHGADVNARNAQRQTPLDALQAGRASIEKLKQMQEMMKKMGLGMAGLANSVAGLELPTEGWDACEKLLRAAGAR